MAEVTSVKSKINVEVPIFLIFFAFMLGGTVMTNLTIYRTCYVTLGYDRNECALLGSQNKDNMTNALEKIVQPYATVIGMTSGIIHSLFNSILCLLIGPWSDKFGRRPILLSTITGSFLTYVIILIISSLTYASPWFFTLTCIPSICLGGMSSCVTVSYCYVTDTTAEKNRGMRITFFEVTIGISMLIGTISSSYVFQAIDYVGVFAVCTACTLAALLYTIFMIPESVKNVQTENRLKSLFSLDNFKDIVTTTIKRRENHNRFMIIFCLIMTTLLILVILAEGSVMFLYLREQFGWSLRQYTLYSSASSAIGFLGTFIGIYLLHKLLKVPETILLLMGFTSMMNGALLQALATKDWHIYFASGVKSFGGVLGPMMRSLISKLVMQDEAGKIFSLIVTLETLSGLIATPLYTTIYNSTITTMPQMFNYVSAALYFIEIAMTITIIAYKRLHREIPYEELTINVPSEN